MDPSSSSSKSNPEQNPRPKQQPYLDRLIVSDAPLAEIEASDFTDQVPAKRRRDTTSGPWVLIGGFGFIILLGTLLLKLPAASATDSSISWGEAFFTATSATTVTGLVVLNTANDFSFVGQIIILMLIQVGGVGFIAFSVLLLRLIGRRITLQTRFIVQQTVGSDELSGALKLALYVLVVTLALEAAGALLLWARWRTAIPDNQALWYAIFHAVSSYCNAGFDLFSGTDHGAVFGFGRDWYTLGIMGVLILLGSFGITVLYDMVSARTPVNWALSTRLTIVMAAVLTLIGFFVLVTDPNLRTTIFPDASRFERWITALFAVISARTAGVTVFSIESLREPTQLILMLWMFIGGAPASMAGGVTTSTVSVLIAAVLATARGHRSAVSFGRTLPNETVAKAVAIMTVSTILVTIVTFILATEMGTPIFATAFETVSAFANAGYSLNFTGELSELGRILIALTMFWGRLGPLTIVVALAQSEQPTLVRYPAEPVILG